MLEIAYVEDWNDQLDVGIVADTIHRVKPTRLTERILLGGALKFLVSDGVYLQ
jgi:hypothetical protein